MNIDLLSNTSRVETPFITVTIGDVKLGNFAINDKKISLSDGKYNQVERTYPNYMKSLSINKVNGALNTYILTLDYMITQDDDPNLFEKIFSKAKKSRLIKLSYGDLSIPSYIYKEEEAFIKNITSNMNIASSMISYTITCVSKALLTGAGTFDFPKRVEKPSTVIMELLYDTEHSLKDIFAGMQDELKVKAKKLILDDDRVVEIKPQTHMRLLDYLKYLVSCMSNVADEDNSVIRTSWYTLTVCDDITDEWGGLYFKITKVDSKVALDSLSTYEINVGFPQDRNNVLSFSIDDNETYSILYDYSNEINQSKYVYRLDDNGKMITEYSPTIALDKEYGMTTQLQKSWWTQVTQYPIKATITLKGLLKPAILMTTLKINVWFFGKKHISSGYYIITKEQDMIDSSGYKTTLSLVRIRQDDNYDN